MPEELKKKREKIDDIIDKYFGNQTEGYKRWAMEDFLTLIEEEKEKVRIEGIFGMTKEELFEKIDAKERENKEEDENK